MSVARVCVGCPNHCIYLAIFVCQLVLASCVYDEKALFIDFINKYKKNYKAGTEEYSHRFENFQISLHRIQKLNNVSPEKVAALYGVTQHADLSPSEFQFKFLQKNPINNGNVPHGKLRRRRSVNATVPNKQIPPKFDWRDQNVVSAVNNQGDCGACWAFSTVETIETMYAIKTGELPTLSVQQIIDCAENGNYGCQGGDTCAALSWMNSTKVHIVPASEYPFTHVTGVCKTKNPPNGVQVKTFTCQNLINNENQILELIATHGPVAVAVDATMWQDYLGGIIKYNCESYHNHAVQIVGYDRTGPVPYYIVRNSWGPQFGLDGYLYIAVGKNLCGIAAEVATVGVV